MIIPRDQVNIIIKNGQAKGLSGQAVLDGLISRGYEPEGVDVAAAKADIAKRAQPTAPADTTAPSSVVDTVKSVGNTIIDTVKDIPSDVVQTAKDLKANAENGQQKIADAIVAGQAGDQGRVSTFFQTAGALAGAGAGAVGDVAKGALKIVLTPHEEQSVRDVIGKLGAEAIANPFVQKAIDYYHSLSPEAQRNLDATGGLVSLATTVLPAGAIGKAATAGVDALKTGAAVTKDALGNIVQGTADAAKSAVGATKVAADVVTGSPLSQGMGQVIKDIMARGPQAVKNGADALAESAARAERIRAAAPAVQDAIKSNLDERIINTITSADKPTVQAYKDVVKIAEDSANKIGSKEQPTKVGGELAAKQYDLIEKQRKSVGAQIGDAVKSLDKTTKVDIKPVISQADEVLAQNGIKPIVTEKGISLDFSNSSFTNAERAKISELYNLVHESGSQVTPLSIYNKNKLFSKLKRESNFDGIGNIIVDTGNDQKSSLFDVFKNIYTKTLEDVAPSIKPLNRHYAELSNLTDDIENSIFKTPNFQVVKSVDPAEFAKVNLRRIFGDSQSSPVFEGVADAMDKAARGLGYTGATPKTVAEFAQEMRKLYPDTIPKTGFTGGIKLGLGDIASKVLEVGTPQLKDQQAALKNLLDSLIHQN